MTLSSLHLFGENMTNTSKAVAFGAIAASIAFMCNLNPLNSFIGVGASYPDTDDDPTFVTCQSAIKLTHKESGGGFFLNSSGQNYGSGSSQQVVSISPNEADHTSHWVVREADDDPVCDVGQHVACNSVIRLTHNQSGKNLHSHQFRSALSGQQEISCFGDDGKGDGGDNWRVICERPTDEYWLKGRPVRFQHVESDKYLGATQKAKFTESNCGNCPILHHLEACGRGRKDDYSIFTADSGIFLSL